MSNKRASDDPRGNLFLADPDKLVIIEDPAHPLYQRHRAERPLTDSFIASIDARGVLEPVVCRKEGDDLIVTAGRRRTRAAREVNKRRRARGETTMVRVPYVTKRLKDREAIGVMLAENAHRMDDDLISNAESAAHAIAHNVPEEEAAADLGVTVPTFRMWLKLADMAEGVKKLVADERIRLHDAVRVLAKLPHGQQLAAAKELAESAPTRKTRKEQGKPAHKPKGASTTSRFKLLTDKGERWDTLSEREQLLVRWLLGEKSEGDLVALFPRLRGIGGGA